MTDALTLALDRFDVPPTTTGLADRIMAATIVPTTAPFTAPRRDRRGMWRRGRQVVLGALAVGLLSAGAIASGFFGSVGINVPVLTAMLAPKPKPVTKPVHLAPKPPVARTAVVVTPQLTIDTGPVGLLPRPLLPGERMALREERRERRQAFAAEHPVAAAMIRERVREKLQRRALERQQALMTPGIDPSIPGARALDLSDRIALARAARRDRIIAEKMIDRRIQAREAKMAENQAVGTGPGVTRLQPQMPQLTPEDRVARRERFQQMSPEERTQLRDWMQQRRAARLERQRQNAGQNQSLVPNSGAN